MKILFSIWNWLNGNKMVFGIFLLAVVLPNVPPDMMLWFIPVTAIVKWLGGILTGVGGFHKFIKANTDPGPNG
jgi:hypothetical protein